MYFLFLQKNVTLHVCFNLKTITFWLREKKSNREREREREHIHENLLIVI